MGVLNSVTFKQNLWSSYTFFSQQSVRQPSLEQLPLQAQIKKIFGKEWKLILAIAKAESDLRCEAVGDHKIAYVENGIEYGKSYGLMQIRHLPGRPSPTVLLNCTENLRYAKKIFDKQGATPWSAYTNNSYKKFYE